MQKVKVDTQVYNELLESFSVRSELELLVERDMLAEGYDPLNINDVKEYWRQKGIVVDG